MLNNDNQEQLIQRLNKTIINFLDIYELFWQRFFEIETTFNFDFDVELNENQIDKVIQTIGIPNHLLNIEFPTNYSVNVELESVNELYFYISTNGYYKRNATLSDQCLFLSKEIKKEILKGIDSAGMAIAFAIFEGVDLIEPDNEQIKMLLNENDTDDEEIAMIISNILNVQDELNVSLDELNNYLNNWNQIKKQIIQLNNEFA